MPLPSTDEHNWAFALNEMSTAALRWCIVDVDGRKPKTRKDGRTIGPRRLRVQGEDTKSCWCRSTPSACAGGAQECCHFLLSRGEDALGSAEAIHDLYCCTTWICSVAVVRVIYCTVAEFQHDRMLSAFVQYPIIRPCQIHKLRNKMRHERKSCSRACSG